MANKGALALLTVVAALGTAGAYFALKDKLGPGPGPGPEPDKLQASISASPKTGSAPLTVNFILSIQGGVGPFTAVWAFGDGTVGSGLTTKNIYTILGSYLVSATITDSRGNQLTVFEGIGVDAPPPPPPPPVGDVIKSFSFNPKIGIKPLVVLFTLEPSDFRSAIEWNFGDGSAHVFDQTIVSHTYFSPGAFVGSVSVVHPDGRFDSRSFTVIVEPEEPPPPPPLADLISNFNQSPGSVIGETFIVPFSIALGVPNFEIQEIRWKWGDGLPDTLGLTSVDHTYFNKGNFPGSVTVLATDGRSETRSFLVSVPSLGAAAPMGEIVVTGKQGNNFDLFANFNGKQPLQYNWNFGDGFTGSGQTVSHKYEQAGTFTISVNVTDPDGKSGSDTVTVTATVQVWKLGDVVIRSISIVQLNSIVTRIAISIRNDNFFVRGAVEVNVQITELPSNSIVALASLDTFLTEGDIDTVVYDVGLFPGNYELEVFVWEKGTAVPISFPKTKLFSMS